MNRSHLTKVIGAGVIAAGLTVLPATLPASAQTTTTPDNNNTTTTTTTPRSDVYDSNYNRDFDWGWLGLLGLSGLLGLLPRKREEQVRSNTVANPDRDPTVRGDYR